jgi:hypothetical protein
MLTKEELNKAAATVAFVAAKATKYILKYGAANQLADILNGTGGKKFEAEERVKVVRDYLGRAATYYQNVAKNSDPMEREALMSGIDAILAVYYRAGNCGENSAIAFCLLEQLATVGPLREWLLANGVTMDYWRLATTGDHSFCVIRLESIPAVPMEIDGEIDLTAMEIENGGNVVVAVQSDLIICDPWAKDNHVIDVQNFFMNNQQEISSLASSRLDALKSALSEKYTLDPSVGRRLNLMELSFNIFCSFVSNDGKNPSTYFQNKKTITGVQRPPSGSEWQVGHPAKDERALLSFESDNLNFDTDPGQKQFTIALYEQLIGYFRLVYDTLINYIAHASLFYPPARN